MQNAVSFHLLRGKALHSDFHTNSADHEDNQPDPADGLPANSHRS